MTTGNEPRVPLLLLCCIVLLVVGGAGFAFDRLLVREGVTRTESLILSNALTGGAAALLFYQLGKVERERRMAVRERLHIIAEMNHHIRNALQVITYAAAAQQRTDSTEMEMIHDSVERIEWALREVLPASDPAMFEDPARLDKQTTPAN